MRDVKTNDHEYLLCEHLIHALAVIETMKLAIVYKYSEFYK